MGRRVHGAFAHPTRLSRQRSRTLTSAMSYFQTSPPMFRQRFGYFAGVLDEKPRDRAQRAVLQGHDSDRYASHWQLDGQHREFRVLGKPQRGNLENRQKAASHQEADPRLSGIGDDRRAGIIEPDGAKGFRREWPDCPALPWRQHPGFVDEFSQRDPAPASPRALRAGRNNTGVLKKKLEVELLVCDGTEFPRDQEIDVTLAQFFVQRLDISGHEMKHD